ncbi:MAG: hypothetical protein KDE22_10680 [Rhodobacterales bacterium]|nr:hypothetical protein [Rhodobacterales bacterium]
MTPQTRKRLLAPLFALTIAAPVLGACEEQGPAEALGEKIDNAVESTAEAVEEAAEKAQ